MSSFSFPHPATSNGSESNSDDSALSPRRPLGEGEGGGGGGGTKRQMTFQTSLSVLDITERFEHISSGKMIHWFLVYCYIQNNKALKQSTMQ